MAASSDSEEIFSNLASKFTQLLQVRSKGDRDILEQTLSELNVLDYTSPFVKNNTKAVLLINQCCCLINPGEESLVTKYCQLITNLVHKQSVLIEGRTLTLLINWFFETLRISGKNIVPDLLCALQHVIQSNNKNLDILIPLIIKADSPVLLLTGSENSPEIILRAIKCLQTCITPPEPRVQSQQFHKQFLLCTDIFKTQLNRDPPEVDEAVYCKILICCLTGLCHIILQDAEILNEEHGFLLGYIKTYMVYGIDGVEFLKPTKVTPILLSVPELSTNIQREKKGGKVTRQRKHRTASSKAPVETKEWIDDEVPTQFSLAINVQSDGSTNGGNLSSKMKTSESDYSDSESARTARLDLLRGQLRQTALALFFHVIKNTDKQTMFSNWFSFVPENHLSGKHNITTSILKDPSSKGRTAALNALLLLLDSSKFYLSQAEISEKNTAFTPFSEILGLTLKELYRCMFLALNEISTPVLVQVLKCLSALVQATPYARLGGGIITKVIRNVRVFLYHKDARVQSAALIVFCCILASDPVMPETTEALTKHTKSTRKENCEENKTDGKKVPECNNSEDIDYANFSSDEEELVVNPDNQLPWILEKLIFNLGVKSNGEIIPEIASPSPVKLESLQVMSAMSRNYFESLMVPHFQLIIKAVNLVLSDKNLDVRLHAGKLVDFIGQALNQYFSSEDSTHFLLIDQGVTFWQTILKEPLTAFLQNEKQEVLRVVGCDCIGSIGAHIFGRLQRNTQILCVTLLFACSRDEDIGVKAAAVRSLAICVLYPSSREDHGFVVDTAIAIHALMQDKNVSVRIKASWGMGNLSDAVLLNSLDPKIEEGLPHTLLLVLIHTCMEGCEDSDKVKMNAVRALGNLLQLLTNVHFEHQLGCEFLKAMELSISAVLKCATSSVNMKVRWNSCYALGNILKNVYLSKFGCWQERVYHSLVHLVKNFRNFKVRINAALAFSCPCERWMYKKSYFFVWNGLLEALEESQNAQDFTEYKHKDHLVEQICLSLAHMTILLKKDDLAQLHRILVSHSETFSVHLKKVYDRLLPEKSTILFDAAAYIKSLGEDEDLNHDQTNVLTILESIFVNN